VPPRTRIVGAVSQLPDHAFGYRTLIWWGVVGFMVIEGTAFILGAGSYFFLMNHTTPWPPLHRQPGLLVSGIFTVLMLLSEIPNVWTSRAAHAQRPVATRVGLVLMSVAGLLLIGVRFQEFSALNVRWDENAYGSIVWALLVIHTTHLLTDVLDTVVLTAIGLVHEIDVQRFSDVADNCLYWHFVALAWIPIYAILYWVPRMSP
jgi:cytochrome c oxidase subunit I+III